MLSFREARYRTALRLEAQYLTNRYNYTGYSIGVMLNFWVLGRRYRGLAKNL